MSITFPIVGAALLFVVVLLGVLSFVISKVRKKSQAAIDERFDESQILCSDPMANFFGQQSKGAAQVRGNGGLVLTADLLWFRQAVPERELEIPLSSVTGVRIEKWFLKKSKGRPLVIVDFDSGDGPDAAAWLVRNHELWKTEIEKRKS